MCVSLCLIQSLVRCPLDFRIILQNLKSIGPIVWSQSPKMHFCNIPRRTPHHAITDVISLQICLNTTFIHWHGLSFQMYHFLSDFMKLHISPVLLLGEFEKSPSMLIGTVCMYVCLFVTFENSRFRKYVGRYVCMSVCLFVFLLVLQRSQFSLDQLDISHTYRQR